MTREETRQLSGDGGGSCICERRLRRTGGFHPSRSTGYNREAGGRGEEGGIFS